MLRTSKPPVEIPAEMMLRPALADDVHVHRPLGEDGEWFLQRGTQSYFRITPAFGRLAEALDGSLDHERLAGVLGVPWRPQDVTGAVEQLARSGLLRTDREPPRRPRRVRFVYPLTVQFTLLDPTPLLRRSAPLFRVLGGRTGTVAGLVLAAVGLVFLALHPVGVVAVLSRPPSLSTYLLVLAAMLGGTVLHEIGHGGVLTACGGHPRRMGVMLMYFSPAFFCDVSDGWRLPRRQQRVAVALAGVVVQLVLAGAASVLALVVDEGGDQGLLLFAVLSYWMALGNLIPFVKFDGYIALMSHVDVPHLRPRAMTDAKRFLAHVLLGAHRRPELPQLPWAAAYGTACLVFPIYLLFQALWLWSGLLTGSGLLGALVVATALGWAVVRGVQSTVGFLRDGRANGAPGWRVVVTAVALASAAAGALLVPVQLVTHGGFVRAGDRLEIVCRSDADCARFTPGDEVRLLSRGLVLSREIGSAVIADEPVRETVAPLGAVVPVRDDVARLPVRAVPAVVVRAPDADTGGAAVDGPRVPVWKWLYVKTIAPFLGA